MYLFFSTLKFENFEIDTKNDKQMDSMKRNRKHEIESIKIN